MLAFTPELNIDGIVGEGDNTVAYARAASRAAGNGPLVVNLNSPGGLASEGMAIHNILKSHPGEVRVNVDWALSAASLIAAAGDTITVNPGGVVMIHDPSAITIGDAAAHEQSRSILEKLATLYAGAYAASNRLGRTAAQLREDMIQELWLDGPEAVDLGFADAASSDLGASACAPPAFDLTLLTRFTNAPARLVALAQKKARPMKPVVKKPAPVVDDEIDEEITVVADVTSDILARAATAKLSAAEAANIVMQAKGNLDTARDLIIDAVAKAGGDQRHVVGDPAGGDVDAHSKALGAALDAKLLGKTAAGPFAGMKMSGLMGEWLRARSIKLVGNDETSIVKQALSARQPFMTGDGGGFATTSDFPVILGDSMQKRLAALFVAADSGVSKIASTGTISDFRQKSIGKLSSFPALEAIAEAGEFTFGELVEEGEKISVGTFGRAINISLQTLVNDNLGAVDRSIRDVAFAAVNLKSTLILAAMLTSKMSDGKTLFDPAHGNEVDSAHPSIASLSAMRAITRQQKALDGTSPLGLTPSIILVPSALETAAQLANALIHPIVVDQANPFAGTITIAVEPRLDALDQNAWYGFVDPSLMPAIEFDTLDGMGGSPKLEVQYPADFNRLGTAFRCWWACGASPIEWRAAVRNSGDSTDTA